MLVRVLSRSVTDSGIAFGLDQMMSLRRIHPSSCNANATRHGMPRRFFAGEVGDRACESIRSTVVNRRNRAALSASACPAQRATLVARSCALYESPMFSQSVPSSASTRRTSANSARMVSTYSAGDASSAVLTLGP